MPDELSISHLKLNLPPHARIARIDFDTAPGTCLVYLDDETKRIVLTEHVSSIHGARIRQETVRLVRKQPPIVVLLSARMADWGARSTQQLFRHLYDEETDEIVDCAIAVRVSGLPELLYLVADSFNFRKTLGTGSTNLGETNLKELVRRLVLFAPHAAQDAFVTAVARSMPLPPPVASIKDFLWIVARSDLGDWRAGAPSPETPGG